MKITSKVAKFNFDEKRFIEILDVNKNDKIQLDELFNLLAGKMSIYFSIEEQIAIRNILFPNSRGESVENSRQRTVRLSGFDEGLENPVSFSQRENQKLKREKNKRLSFSDVLIATQSDYEEHTDIYMVRRQDFIDIAIFHWKEYMISVSKQLEKSFLDYDSFFKRNALNYEQVVNLMQLELRISPYVFFGNATRF